MNILDAEEMAEAQQLLLHTQSHQPYTFAPPEAFLASPSQDITSKTFPAATRQIEEQTRRMVSTAHNLKCLSKEDPSAAIKAFAYAVFCLIFPVGSHAAAAEKVKTNESLLETVKCSLYSRDLNFNQVGNKGLNVDNLQAKVMLAHFFHSLTRTHQFNNAQKIRYIEWSLQKNPLLQELFVLFYRIILAKLYVEGADDYEAHLNFSEAVTNLIEYLDISYRNFGELFLITEESYFLASVDQFFVMGQYVENGGYLAKQPTKTEEAKANLGCPESPSSKHQLQRKNGVVEKDIKLFNFILESGRESHHMNDKDFDIQTPHFKDSHEFAFGRKRKEEQQLNRQEELKKEFEKFFMSSEAESVEQREFESKENEQLLPSYLQMAGLPLKMSEEFESRPRKQTEQSSPPVATSFLKKSTFNESLIHELEEEVVEHPKVNPQVHHKNIVMVKDKNLTTFSPQINNNLKYQGFSSFLNDGIFLDQDANHDLFKSSSGQNADNPFPYLIECKCFDSRKKRNQIISKVVDFSYAEAKTYRPPKFLQNLKYSQNIGNSIKPKPFPKESINHKQYPSNKDIRKPSFLKFIKKDKEYCDKSHSSRSKSKKSTKGVIQNDYKQKFSRFQLDKQTVNRINDKCTAYSTIISKNQFEKQKNLSTKSLTKREQSSSLSKQTPVTQSIIKNFDSKYINHRPGLGSTWKFAETFKPSPKNIEKQNLQGGVQTSRNENVRVYAPVNIIAPTVYFNGVTERSNRVTFTVNDGGLDREREKCLKMSERHIRTQTNYFPSYQRLANPHQRYI